MTTYIAPKHLLEPLLWLIVAISIGLLVATQPLLIVVAVSALTIISFFSSFTPLTVLTVLLILAPMRALIATESSLTFPLDIGQILIILFIGAWIVFRVIHNQGVFTIRWSVIHIPLVVFIIVTALTIFTSTSFGAWLNEWLKWVLMLIVSLLVYNSVHYRQWQWLIFGLTVAGIANAIIGIHIFFGGSGALHLLINSRFFRAFGTFGQPNPFGGFMGLLLPLASMMALGYLLASWESWRKFRSIDFATGVGILFYSVSTGLLGIGIVISWSRGAWLSIGISIFIMMIAIPRKWWQSSIIAGGLIVLVGLIWFSGELPITIRERIGSATQELFAVNDVRAVDITIENYAVLERLAHWQAATNMATHHPWLGVGLGNYEIVYNEYRLINWDESLGHAHNFYLNVLAETGIIGAFCYVGMWIAILIFTWQIRNHPDVISRSAGIGIIGTWVYLTIHSLTDNLYVNNLFLHLGVIIGLVAILHNQISYTQTIGKLWHNPNSLTR